MRLDSNLNVGMGNREKEHTEQLDVKQRASQSTQIRLRLKSKIINETAKFFLGISLNQACRNKTSFSVGKEV